MNTSDNAHDLTDDEPITWPEKLRDAADWFDLVDRLLAMIRVEVKSTSTKNAAADCEPSAALAEVAWLMDNSDGVLGLRLDGAVIPWAKVRSLYMPSWDAHMQTFGR